MLTPDKLKSKTFQTTGKGSYRAEDVDSFMEEVSASYEQVFRENGEIIKKMSILANKVEEYKKEEDSLRQALLSAQKLADQITSEAKENADKVVADAQRKADEILAEAKASAQKLESDAKSGAEEKIYSANKEANEILGGVNRKVTQEKLVLEMLQKEVGAFKNKMMDLYKEHLTLLDRLPSIVEKETEEEKAEEVVEEVAEENAPEENFEDVIEELEDVSEESVDEFVFEEESSEEPEEEIKTYEPAVTVADEAEDDGFSLDLNALDDEAGEKADDGFEDIASGADEEDGFSLSLDNIDLDDDEADEEAAEPKASEYASADDEAVTPDDEDGDSGFSFKGFFKKK